MRKPVLCFRYTILLALILSINFSNFAMEQKDNPTLYEEFRENLGNENERDFSDGEFEESDEDDLARSEQDYKDEEQEIRELAKDVKLAEKRKTLAKLIFKRKKLELKNKINNISGGCNFGNFNEDESPIDKRIAEVNVDSEPKDLQNKNRNQLVNSGRINKRKLGKTQNNGKKKTNIIDPRDWSHGSIGWGLGILALLIFWGYRFYHEHDQNCSND